MVPSGIGDTMEGLDIAPDAPGPDVVKSDPGRLGGVPSRTSGPGRQTFAGPRTAAGHGIV